MKKNLKIAALPIEKEDQLNKQFLKIQQYYNQGYHWVVDSDIDAFFDNVDHGLLLKKVENVIHEPEICKLVRQWISADVWDGEKLFTLKKGIPQGSPISPILANLFLDELDERMLGKGYKFVRYADDYLVLCKNPKDASAALELSKDILQDLRLWLDEEDIVSFDHGFKYLGVIFLRSMIMVPFAMRKKKRRVIFWPPPFDLQTYILKKRKGW